MQTDHVIQARRPDMIIVDEKNKRWQIIDFAVPFDTRVAEQEKEKVFKYLDLARELKKLWNERVKIFPVMIRALGATPKALPKRVKEIEIATRIVAFQKTVLLQSARILRQVLEIWGNLLLPKLKNINPLIYKEHHLKSVYNRGNQVSSRYRH